MTRNPFDAAPHWFADGGMETAMLFHEGFDLPHFSALPLIETEEGRAALDRYFARFLGLAAEAGAGYLLDTNTWRAGAAWAGALGRSRDDLRRANQGSVAFARGIRDRHAAPEQSVLINGVVGPAGDGYAPAAEMTPDEAERMHAHQIGWLAEAGVDVLSALTITHEGEAIGWLRAAKATGRPTILSFTLETDGRLPSGAPIDEAIGRTDEATGGGPLFYMVNCAHPDHFRETLPMVAWRDRIGGVRGNASRLSHAELDAAETLDDGDPDEFGRLTVSLTEILPGLRLFGGCCGTDHRHVARVAHHLRAAEPA